MTQKTLFGKSTAAVLSVSLAVSTMMPISTANAHEIYNSGVHYGTDVHLDRRTHREFHNTYGRGYKGTRNYGQHVQRQNAKRKKRDRRDLIAAGIIGLAVGAIIASESSKRRSRGNQPQYQYQPQPYGNDYNTSYNHSTNHPIPLDDYNRAPQNEPEIITFNDPSDLQPWSQGWREWCSNRFRSFNPTTGTYRGYDGLDHFCVPK